MDYYDLEVVWGNLEWCENELNRVTAHLGYIIEDLLIENGYEEDQDD